MDDELTRSVLDYQAGLVAFEGLRDKVVLEAYHHLNRSRRRGEDEVSDFLLGFYNKVEGLVTRFQPRGLPFRHYLLRTLRWQWHTFRSDRAKERRQRVVAINVGLADRVDEELVGEPSASWGPLGEFSEAGSRRLVLLALKAAPWLEDAHCEAISEVTGVDLAWLQGCQHRLRHFTDRRRDARQALGEKRSEAYYRRLMAEDEAQRELDPERRQVHERRASVYRHRLANLTIRQNSVSTSPTHQELARLLGMPKGTVDSGLYHLKKKLRSVYSSPHDNIPSSKYPTNPFNFLVKLYSQTSAWDRAQFGCYSGKTDSILPVALL